MTPTKLEVREWPKGKYCLVVRAGAEEHIIQQGLRISAARTLEKYLKPVLHYLMNAARQNIIRKITDDYYGTV